MSRLSGSHFQTYQRAVSSGGGRALTLSERVLIGQTVSHYKVIERIGTGGMGAVYKAEDTRLGVNVVLKFLHAGLVGDERAKKRFIHEAQAASALDHPNICAVHGIDETPDGQMFIAMRYYDGESLKERIARRAPLSVREAFQIAFSIAQGLSAAHRHGVVHRDIKPANVVITSEGFVKILDFGLAKIAGRTQLTASDTTLGTVSYMAPEQAGARDVDNRTDIWALGVVLYEMLTGKLPFKGDIDQAMVYSILSLPHVPVREVNPDIPDECAALIDKCLEKDPDFRYQNTEELLDDIVALSKELGWGSSIAVGSVVPVSGVVYAPRGRRRMGARGLVATLVVVAAVATAGWWATRGEPSPYTTDLRIAMMPIENRTDPTFDPLVDGISETASDILETISLADRSMWILPYSRVAQANLAAPEDARDVFGVNRVVTGTLQQFGSNKRLTLDLCDVATMEPIRSVFLNFLEDDLHVIRDSLGVRLATLVSRREIPAAISDHWPPDEAVASFLYGTGYLQRRNTTGYLGSALEMLGDVVARDSTFAFAAARLATAHAFQYRLTRDARENDEAVRLSRRAIDLAPAVHQPYLLAGWVLASGRLWDEAIAAYQGALRVAPGNENSSRRLARIYERQDRFDESHATLRSSVERYPDYFAAHRALGLFYHRNQQTDDAIEEYQLTLSLAPSDALTLNNMGSIRYERGEWQKARELYERAFRIDPNCDTSSNVGLLLFLEKRYEESASYYEFSFEYCDSTAPSFHQQWGNWAKALYWTHNHDEEARNAFLRAIELAERELERAPDDADIVAQLIEYYYYTDDRENTNRVIEHGQRVTPNDKDVLFATGNAFERFDDRELALKYIGESIRHGYSIPEVMNTPLLADLVEDERFQHMTDQNSSSSTSR